MRCPECYFENEAHVKQCVKCGADLTQTAIMEREVHRTNQVWNTDIDAEQNRKNSRVALLVLGVAVLLMIVLVVALMLYLPTVISYSMDSFTLPDINLSDFVDEVFWENIEVSRTEPAPEPLTPMTMGENDYEFLNALTAYAIELSYIEDAEQQREIHQMFHPEFEYLAGREFQYNSLYLLAQDTHRVAKLLSDPAVAGEERMALLNELSTIVWTAEESFGFLSDDPDVLDYYTRLQMYTEAALEVEYSLRFQLHSAAMEWSRDLGCYVVYYTNDTPYTVDVNITNDFATDSEHYSSAETYYYIFPNTTLAIPLYDLEKVGDRDHTWTIGWDVVGIYVDLIPIEEYYD